MTDKFFFETYVPTRNIVPIFRGNEIYYDENNPLSFNYSKKGTLDHLKHLIIHGELSKIINDRNLPFGRKFVDYRECYPALNNSSAGIDKEKNAFEIVVNFFKTKTPDWINRNNENKPALLSVEGIFSSLESERDIGHNFNVDQVWILRDVSNPNFFYIFCLEIDGSHKWDELDQYLYQGCRSNHLLQKKFLLGRVYSESFDTKSNKENGLAEIEKIWNALNCAFYIEGNHQFNKYSFENESDFQKFFDFNEERIKNEEK